MTKVLVVDDSALMRRLIGGVLTEAGFQVDTARNGAEGLERLLEGQPDVVTLDINMPEMDGLTALSMMMQARPTPVVMVSSLTREGAQATFEALALGAVDFIAKPGGTISLTVEDIGDQLIDKVRAASRSRLRRAGHTDIATMRTAAAPASQARVSTPRVSRPPRAAPDPQLQSKGVRPAGASTASRPDGVVMIGVSTGGPRTLEDILPRLPADFPWAVLVAQHMPANFTDAFAQRMDRLCKLTVREVAGTLPLEAGGIYIGKGGTDMVVVERLGRIAVQPRPESPAHPWHPSVDVLVDSALKLVPPRDLIGVQLTGMGNDGAQAMARLKRQGGRTIAESEDTAVVFGMPQELIELDGATLVLPCQDVARQVCHWIMKSR